MITLRRLKDTIFAPATSPNGNVIGIIRVSGEKAFEICDKIFEGKRRIKDSKSSTILHGYIVDKKRLIDEVVVNVYKGPNSYTGENMVEIFFHSHPLILEHIQNLLEKEGAKKAKPGEFTERAVLYGKMDLIQAEAVNALYKMKSLDGISRMLAQRKGEISQEIKKIMEKLKNLLIRIEASIEFPDEVEEDTKILKKDLLKVLKRISSIINKAKKRSFEEAEIKISIIGTPNVGKSTLFNAILEEERAIVTPIPGTTRDAISERVRIGDVYVKIYDTAGVRSTLNTIEKIGVKKTQKTLESSDFLILVLDVSKKLESEDKKLIKLVKKRDGIIVANKIDLKPKWNGVGIKISAKYRKGIDILLNEIEKRVKEKEKEFIALSGFELSVLEKVKKSIENGIKTEYMDMMAEELKKAIELISGLESSSFNEEILNEIFGKFCIGK